MSPLCRVKIFHAIALMSQFRTSLIVSAFQSNVATPMGTRSANNRFSAYTRMSQAFINPQQPVCGLLYSEVSSSSSLDPLSSESDDDDDYVSLQAEKILKNDYPSFHSLLSKNENIWKTLSELSTDFTLFAPNELAFENLGSKRIKQLKDERNLETAQKMGLYHVVATDVLSPAQLQTEDWTVPKPTDGSPRPITIGAVITMAGKVPIGRRKTGGFLGWGAKDEGNDVVIGPSARIVRSFKIVGKKGASNAGTCIVHEMDGLISPEILWRYCDQLTIPGLS
jgi:Fasciclin domain